MSDEPGGDDLRLELRYRHGRGGFTAYFAALAEGRALGSRDVASGRVSFPPRPDADPDCQVCLSGLGTVAAVTRGPALLPLNPEPVQACFALQEEIDERRRDLGRLDESLELAKEEQDRARALLEADPGNADWKRDLRRTEDEIREIGRERKPAAEAGIAALEQRLAEALAGLERDWR